jgi:general secretion pathway protein G
VGKVRETAREARCTSNLRQIGQLLNIYANQNKGLFPASMQPDPSGSGTTSWWTLVQREAGGPDLPSAEQESVLLCPLAVRTYPASPAARRTYGLNFVGSSTSTRYGLLGIVNPARTILVAETIHNANGDGWAAFDTLNNAKARLDWRHAQDTARMLFADGSVRPVRRDEPELDLLLQRNL